MANIVVETIRKVIRTPIPTNSNHESNIKKTQCSALDEKDCLEGKVDLCGTTSCRLSNERGGVYGFAIKIKDCKEKANFFNSLGNFKLRIKDINEWKPIGNDYYPLYWGRDINLGFRLFEHMKVSKTSATIALSRPQFMGYKIIYGAVLCDNRDVYENILHSDYTDLIRNL